MIDARVLPHRWDQREWIYQWTRVVELVGGVTKDNPKFERFCQYVVGQTIKSPW